MSSIENIKEKLKLLDDVLVGNNQSDKQIEKAQEYLEVKLPDSFKEYLKNFGNLSFEGFEFYGLTKNDDFKNSSIPNFIWATKDYLNRKILPKGYVVFYSDNEQWLYCLDTNSIGDIVIWDINENKQQERFEVEFLVFLEEFIDEILEEK